ncbi:MAG: PD40 domain-containing protein [Phycisphaerales bacterium]|nr:MAG: PD40 domain-containing protein [Phycisphaerales bacterium]
MKKARLLVFVLAFGLGSEVANADFAFGNPTPLPAPINLPDSNSAAIAISADGLEMFLASDRPGGYGSYDLLVARRETTNDHWGEPVNLGPVVNSSGLEAQVSLSADGLSLYFSDANTFGLPRRAGGIGGFDIWMTTRPTSDGGWSEPINPGPPINSQ